MKFRALSTLAQRLTELSVKRGLRDALAQVIDQPLGSVLSGTYVAVLKQCGNAKALAEGRQVHAHITASGFAEQRLLGNLLMHMYAKCGDLNDATRVFAAIQGRNEFSWGILLSAFAQNGHLADASDCFCKMPSRNLVIWNSMLAVLSQQGSLSRAAELFDEMPCRNVVSWTALVVGYAENGHPLEAIETFRKMLLVGECPDEVAFLSVLDACARLAREHDGRSIHRVVEQSPFGCSKPCNNAIINMYGKVGLPDEARRCFNTMGRGRNCISWSSMITAYAQNAREQEALEIYDQMMAEAAVDIDPLAFISVLDACASLPDIDRGKAVHAEIVSRGFQSVTILGNGLIHMYGKCGLVEEAKSAFDCMTEHNTVSWTALLSTYVQQGCSHKALQLFRVMDLEGAPSNDVTVVTVLDACKSLGVGKAIHNSLSEESMTSFVATALVSMYANCGSLSEAGKVFQNHRLQLPTPWNAMIVALDKNGRPKEAVELFVQMQLEGVMPTNVTFLCVLSACSHAGLLAEARACFLSMLSDYELVPEPEHYSCAVDVVGRAGRLAEAEDLVGSMPFQPDDRAWRTLLFITGNARGQEGLAIKAAVPLMQQLDSSCSILSNMLLSNDEVSPHESEPRKAPCTAPMSPGVPGSSP